MQRWEESERGGTLTAGLCRRHVSMKRRSTPAKYRCRSSAAMPLATKALAVQLVMQTSTLYARQIRHEVHQQIGEVWASSTYARVRREAGMTRKRTTTEKREACPIAQHTYAQSIHDLGYLPEHFVFIDEVRRRGGGGGVGLPSHSWLGAVRRRTRRQRTGTFSTATPTPAARRGSSSRGPSTSRSVPSPR